MKSLYKYMLLPALLLLLAACSNRWSAPVEDRTIGERDSRSQKPSSQADSYTVKRGDSLYTIGFKFGLDYHDIAHWNDIGAPYTIFPGQKLHLRAGQKPYSKPVAKSSSKSSTVKTQGLKSHAVSSTNSPAAQTSTQAVVKPVAQTSPKPAAGKTSVSSSKPSQNRTSVKWQWPTNGTVIETFLAGDPTRSGIDITGKEGQAIRAVSSGSVVYSGNGLLGYGELIIIKHNDRFLSAYAHNRKRLVSEGETIRAGQKIAEMGRGENGRIKLHFEIRANGKPVNPRQYLPKR